MLPVSLLAGWGARGGAGWGGGMAEGGGAAHSSDGEGTFKVETKPRRYEWKNVGRVKLRGAARGV